MTPVVTMTFVPFYAYVCAALPSRDYLQVVAKKQRPVLYRIRDLQHGVTDLYCCVFTYVS